MQIDRLLRSKRKTIALIIEADGRLVVRAPLHASLKSIHALVAQKADWIQAKQQALRSRQVEIQPRQFAAGETFWYLGRLYALEIVPSQAQDRQGAGKPPRPSLRLEDKFYLDESARLKASQVFEAWYKTQARARFTRQAALFAARFGCSYQRIRLSSARTRWGSCSSNGTLSFTWRLIMAPPEVIDYVVVHELAHLREKNHSERFWELVQSILPDYPARRQWLKTNGHRLAL